MIDNYFTDAAASHDGRRPDKQIMNEHGELVDDNTDNPRTWDVCVTTYEIANQERRTLQKFAWKYLVIDEVRNRRGIGASKRFLTHTTLSFAGASLEKRYKHV